MAVVNAGIGTVSSVASGGVAHVLDTSTNYTAGKLASFRNNAVEKAYVDYAGSFNGVNGVFTGTLAVTGDFTVATTKFTVAAATGNIVVAGTATINGIVGLSTSSPKATFGGLDIASGGVSLVLGADGDATTRTNATNKEARVAFAHYTNAEESIAIVLGATKVATSVVSVGGGSSVLNAATEVNVYTAATVSTLSGTERLRINSTGQVLALTATGGLGYGTGAGGAVTQITSRTTGVTLNTVCGAITLVSAAGSATPASFTVTNSTVAATDVIRLSQKSGTDKYVLLVTAVAAGSFEITAYTTGGTTTEQPVFNFAVLKAVAA